MDTQPKLKKKAETTNIEAYEYYLKGVFTFEKNTNIKDTKIAQGLLQKSIELDNNLLIAKFMLGDIYAYSGELDKAMDIFISTIKKGQEIGDKRGFGNLGMGHVCRVKGDYKNSRW